MRSAVLTTRLMDSDSATNKGRAGRWPISPNPDKKKYMQKHPETGPNKTGQQEVQPL